MIVSWSVLTGIKVYFVEANFLASGTAEFSHAHGVFKLSPWASNLMSYV